MEPGLPAAAQEIQHRHTGEQEAQADEQKAVPKACGNRFDVHLPTNRAQRRPVGRGSHYACLV
jgi:hypothetical protein